MFIPTMTYGCETWTTKYLKQKLRTAQHAMLRRMLNISLRDKVKNSEIRRKKNPTTTTTTAKQKQKQTNKVKDKRENKRGQMEMGGEYNQESC